MRQWMITTLMGLWVISAVVLMLAGIATCSAHHFFPGIVLFIIGFLLATAFITTGHG